jgi:dTDP-glucose 4,6-dehydratase
MTVLVTGGAGFIGSNFARYWIDRYPDDQVIVLDALTYAGNLANLAGLESKPNYRFIHGHIENHSLVENLLRDHGIGTLVHFAAETHVDRSIVGPDAFMQTNVHGTYALLKAARQVWLDEGQGRPHRFHHVSTDEVYGSLGPGELPFSEASPYAPNSPYAASKAAADHLVRAYRHTYGLTTTTSNCSNNYGPFHFPEKLVPLVITNTLLGMPLPIYGDGRNVRDWLHVADHCRGIELILQSETPSERYNIGGGTERDNLTLVRLVCEIIDQAFEADLNLKSKYPSAPPARGKPSVEAIECVEDRPGHDRRYAIDATRITRQLGFAPSRSLEQGLRDTVAWYLDNEPWWSRVIDGSYRDGADYRSASER